MWGSLSVTTNNSTFQGTLNHHLSVITTYVYLGTFISHYHLLLHEYFDQSLLSTSMWGPASVTISTVPVITKYFYVRSCLSPHLYCTWGPLSVTISTAPEDLYQLLLNTSMWGPASVTISTVPEYFYQLLLSDSMWGPASVTISTVPEDLYQSLPSTSMWGPVSVTISTVPEDHYQSPLVLHLRTSISYY